MSDYILELKGITKVFPGIRALNKVNFQLKRGEIHALMGENGAGKSTFIKIITGVHKAEEGEIYLGGKKVIFRNPIDAQKAGIAAIYQHVTSYPHLTVAENIFICHEKMKYRVIQWKEMNKAAKKLLDTLQAEFGPTITMGTLSVAQQQIVEIAKALSVNARIIIMDEPTAALTKAESEKLYEITEKLRDDGVSIIFISHRLEDMYRLATRVTVFRDSNYIGTYLVNKISNADLIKAMVGRDIKTLYPKPEVTIGDEALRVEDLCRTGYFQNVSFNVKHGEILGLTGLVGARRTEVAQVIFGVEKASTGQIYVNGKKVKIKNPSDAMKHGIGLLTEDRQQYGLLVDWGIGRNITLPELKCYTRHGIINEKLEGQNAKRYAEEVDVKAVSIFDLASSLSGGNQQKVVVAKALGSDFQILILDEPTKGIDVGSKAAIYDIMGNLAKQGYAIIMISSEMQEILGMCDRVVVMCDGRVTGELMRQELDQERILRLSMTKNRQAEINQKGDKSA